MSTSTHRRRAVAGISSIGVALFAGAHAEAQKLPGSKPQCESERDVAGWTVTAGLTPEKSGSLLVHKWETARNFSTHFGLRVTYDTSEDQEPTLQIWHNYKSGAFAMQMPDRRSFTVPLSTDYAVTKANVPPQVIAYLRTTPALIEHTHSGNKWARYRTEGLPEAIEAAESDLALITARQANKECTVHKGWRRFVE